MLLNTDADDEKEEEEEDDDEVEEEEILTDDEIEEKEDNLMKLDIDKSSTGTNGVYFLRNGDKIVSVFKPYDEEMSNSNSKDSHVKRGVVKGDASLKEVAAFMLDHEGFAKVPNTVLSSVEMDGKSKFGSSQEFIDNIGAAEDYSSSQFAQQEVEAIALLDLRLFNLDRHMGNILVDNNKRLIPIDHGFSLPEYTQLSDGWFEWMYWPQANVPVSRETREYFNRIDPIRDARMLLKMGIRQEYVLTYLITHTALKVLMIERNWTLKDIAAFFSRNVVQTDIPCGIERVVEDAIHRVQFSLNNDVADWYACPLVNSFLASVADSCKTAAIPQL